jgi:hypothetical protein
VVWCPHIVTCCDSRSHWWTPGCKESWTWSRGHFSVKWMSLPLENADRKFPLERIQNGDWDTDTDCMSSRNQGPCWDAGDTLDWGKAPGRAETSSPWTPSLWKASPHNDTLKEQVGCHPPAGRPRSPLSSQITVFWSTRAPPTGQPGHHLPAHQADAPQAHWATTLVEDSSTTTLRLQTCLGNTLKQDKMLTE